MEICLYHPGLGYYRGGRERIGSGGDFYTSPILTPAFGAMIECQIAEIIACTPDNYTGDGRPH
jgi:SAM-dependent MidA family methyltransferase